MAPRVVIWLALSFALVAAPAHATRLISASSIGATKKGRPTFRAEIRPQGARRKDAPVAIINMTPKETHVGFELRALGPDQHADLFPVNSKVTRLRVSSVDQGVTYATTWTVRHRKHGRHQASAEHTIDGVVVGTETIALRRRNVDYTQRAR